jgi:hypothetical protein
MPPVGQKRANNETRLPENDQSRKAPRGAFNSSALEVLLKPRQHRDTTPLAIEVTSRKPSAHVTTLTRRRGGRVGTNNVRHEIQVERRIPSSRQPGSRGTATPVDQSTVNMNTPPAVLHRRDVVDLPGEQIFEDEVDRTNPRVCCFFCIAMGVPRLDDNYTSHYGTGNLTWTSAAKSSCACLVELGLLHPSVLFVKRLRRRTDARSAFMIAISVAHVWYASMHKGPCIE